MKKTLLTLLAAAVLLGGTPAGAHAQESAAGPLTVRELIARLPVAAESRAGFKRTAFRLWIDADHDHCNTRNEVLLDEAVIAPHRGADCKLTGGRWVSYYDDTIVIGPSSLDIDHLVPLAEAWDSGASQWDARRRQEYANDLDYPRTWSRSPPKPTDPKATRTRGPGSRRPQMPAAATLPTGSA